MIFIRLLSYGSIFLSIVSCNIQTPSTTNLISTEPVIEIKMTKEKPEANNDFYPQTAFPAELREHLYAVVPAMLRVVSKQTILPQEENLLGNGTDHIPKGPGPVTLRYYDKKIGSDNLSASFKRRDEKSIWHESEITVGPGSYPRSVYLMNLSAGSFENYVLEKSFVEDRPSGSVKRVNVFQFRLKNSSQNIHLQFEAREDVSSLQDKYPKSFHFLKITRTGE
jgi:hypothetical protein